jgi:hypothetical protein
MRSLHREVWINRENSEWIMKVQEKILQSLNMLHKQVKKYFDYQESLYLYTSINIHIPYQKG